MADTRSGLLATSYTDGSLFVVNMRNPKILLRHSQVTSKRQSIGLNTKPVHDPYTALSWNACRLSEGNIVVILYPVSPQPLIVTRFTNRDTPLSILQIRQDAHIFSAIEFRLDLVAGFWTFGD